MQANASGSCPPKPAAQPNGKTTHRPPTITTRTAVTATMADPIDPRLYASSVPPRAQSYTSAPQHNAGQPYYLPATTQHQAPQLSQPAPLSNALDPALEQTSPTGAEGSQDDDEDGEDGEDGDHDGYVMPRATPAARHQLSSQWMLTHESSAHETPGSHKSPGDFKRPRACDSCRGLKVGRFLCATPDIN